MILLENHTRISLAGYNTRQESNRKRKVQSLLQKNKLNDDVAHPTTHHHHHHLLTKLTKRRKHTTHSRIRNRLRKYFSIQRRRKIDLKQTISKTTQRERESTQKSLTRAVERSWRKSSRKRTELLEKAKEREIEDVMRERKRARMRGIFFTWKGQTTLLRLTHIDEDELG